MRFEFKIILLSFAVMFGFAFSGQANASQFYYNCKPTPDGLGVSLCVSCDDHSDELRYTTVQLPDGTITKTDCRPGPIHVSWMRPWGAGATVTFPLTITDAAILGAQYFMGMMPNEVPQDAAELCNMVTPAICSPAEAAAPAPAP